MGVGQWRVRSHHRTPYPALSGTESLEINLGFCSQVPGSQAFQNSVAGQVYVIHINIITIIC